jgi:hypothetical protein
VRHGTTSLFAALDVASGFVIGRCYKRHRAVEFLKFLKKIDTQVPEGLDVDIVMDNYAAHKKPKIKAWLARRALSRPLHEWMNQVERWFAEPTMNVSRVPKPPSFRRENVSVPNADGARCERRRHLGEVRVNRAFWPCADHFRSPQLQTFSAPVARC